MRKLTWEKFKKNNVFIICLNEVEKEVMFEWLENNDYKHLDATKRCDEALTSYGSGGNYFSSWGVNYEMFNVYQLEFSEKTKEMTVAEIEKELGYSVKVVK